MQERVNATGFSETHRDWKENTSIINQEQTSRSEGPGPDPREVKAKIIELIEDQEIRSRNRILEELTSEYNRPTVKICIEDLKRENVLQVEGQ